MSASVFRHGIQILIITLTVWLASGSAESTGASPCASAGMPCPGALFVVGSTSGDRAKLGQDGVTIDIHPAPGTSTTIVPYLLSVCSNKNFTAYKSNVFYCDFGSVFGGFVDWTPVLTPPHGAILEGYTLYSIISNLRFDHGDKTRCGKYNWVDYFYDETGVFHKTRHELGFCVWGTGQNPETVVFTGDCGSVDANPDYSSSESGESKASHKLTCPSPPSDSFSPMSKTASQNAQGPEMFFPVPSTENQ